MRLTPTQIDLIKESAEQTFGPEASVWLFGSRVDDTRRGGDIDLYLELPPMDPEMQRNQAMRVDDLTALRLDPALRECDLHLRRLHYALTQLQGKLPLSGDEETFIDKLDRLEKLGALPSAERWNELRLIRNRMSHEYPDAPEQNAENLNQVHSSIPDLEAALSQATSFAKALAARITGQDRTA